MKKSEKTSEGIKEIPPNHISVHKLACERGEESYIDPKTGYQVMTEYFLLKRGYCCKSSCRHCPYELK